MRIGQNPLRESIAPYKMGEINLCVVTHLPNFTGYHLHRLEVVQLCLTSMRDNSGVDAKILVWDNGSCDEFRQWLQYEYKPNTLILSENIGKTAARTALIRMLPEDSIVGYSDDDIYFYPSWFTPQYELLTAFPNVACVTGYPVRSQFRWGIENTLKWCRENASVDIGRFIPQQYEDDFAESIGRSPEYHREKTKNDADALVTYNGHQAYCTAHHCQFIGFQKTLVQATTYDSMAMGDEKVWDKRLDTLGLRLATTKRLTRHIGNYVDSKLRADIQKSDTIR